MFNGCLRVIPKSHNYGILDHCSFVHISGNHKYCVNPKILTEQFDKNGLHHFESSPGNAILFHPLLIHGSSSNISNLNRKALVIHFKNKNYTVKSKIPLDRYLYTLSNLNNKIKNVIENIKNKKIIN